jgi:hypothetical protein
MRSASRAADQRRPCLQCSARRNGKIPFNDYRDRRESNRRHTRTQSRAWRRRVVVAEDVRDEHPRVQHWIREMRRLHGANAPTARSQSGKRGQRLHVGRRDLKVRQFVLGSIDVVLTSTQPSEPAVPGTSDNWTRRVPVDFLVIGAQKSGTSSLWEVLKQEPWLLAPPIKELNHFGETGGGRSEDAYRAMFPEPTAEGQLRGEATPNYLASYSAPRRIYQHNPDVRMVVLLRDPVDRAISAFQHAQRLGAISARASFEQIYFGEAQRLARGLEWSRIRWDGMYGRHLRRYLEQFEPDQIHVEFFEVLTEEPFDAIHRISSFLGVPTPEFENLPRINPARGSYLPGLTNTLRKSHRSLRAKGYGRSAKILAYLNRMLDRPASKVELTAQLEERLVMDYRPDVIALTGTLGRRPPWPRFQAFLPEIV